MASIITSDTIDEEYPVAGIDNDTQGFRDNFSIIKTGLATAAAEITQLQNSTAKLDAENDFNGTTIADATIALITEKHYSLGTKVSGDNISFLNGHYQTIKLATELAGGATSINFTLADWLDREGYQKIVVEIFDTDSSGNKEVTFGVEGGNAIRYSNNWPAQLLTPTWPGGVAESEAPRLVLEFWTTNQGQNVYANYIGTFA